MADAPTLSPELCRNVSTLARTLVAEARSCALCSPDHPAVRGSLERMAHALPKHAGASLNPHVVVQMWQAEGDTAVAEDRSGLVSDTIGAFDDARVEQLLATTLAIELPLLVNTLEPDGRGDFAWSAVEAVDPDGVGLDPLTCL